MTDFFVFMQLQSTSHSNKHSSLSFLKNYDVSMVHSTNCIIIIVPIPSLPQPLFLTALISCKHSCRFSPLRNTGYSMRKLTIHYGNHPPRKRQGKLPLMQHNTTPRCYTKRNLQIKSLSQKCDILLKFTTPSTPTFLHPSKSLKFSS